MVGARVPERVSLRSSALGHGQGLSLRVLLLTVVAFLALVVPASPAEAHGQLALSVPAKDATVTEPLDAVSLYFTEKPLSYAYFTVTAPDGARVDRHWSHGEPRRLDEPIREFFLVNGSWEPHLYYDGYQVRIPVAHWPGKGVYIAHYWTVASDGDQVRGELRFTYAGRRTTPPKGWEPPVDTPSAALLAAAGVQDTAVGPRPGQTPAGTPSAAAPSDGCTPRTMPETGCDKGPSSQGPAAATTPGAAAESPASGPGAGAESPASSGVDVLVWLLPALLVVGVAVMVARAARPRPDGRSAPGKPAGAGKGAGPRRPAGPGKRAGPGRSAAAPRARRR
ncbi:copper resistance protein CopC [Sphaerisporangium sp. NPDC004334]